MHSLVTQHALGGTAQSTCPDFQGPHLGLKPVTKSPRKVKSSVSKTEPTPPAAAPFQGCVATVPPSPVPQQIPSADTSFDGVDESAPPPPYNEAASRWGRKDDRVPLHRKDDEEEISPPPPFQEIASQTPPTALEGFTDKFTEAVSVSEKTGSQVPQANHLHEEASSPEARHPSAGRGGGYGLDAELAAKREANYDYELEYEAQEWIENVTGEQFQRAFAEELKDGRKLCVLINTIKPGVVRKVNDSRMPFKQMENISNFLKACRTVGVAEHSLFETVRRLFGRARGHGVPIGVYPAVAPCHVSGYWITGLYICWPGCPSLARPVSAGTVFFLPEPFTDTYPSLPRHVLYFVLPRVTVHFRWTCSKGKTWAWSSDVW